MTRYASRMATPVFSQFNLVVSNMEASVAFFELLGLAVAATTPEWQRHHRNVSAGDAADFDLDSEAFARVWNRGWPGRGGGGMGVLGLRFESRAAVDAAVTRVSEAGHPVQQEPYDAFFGARYAVVEDPDGNAIGLMSPIDDSRRTTSPEPPD